MLEDAKDRMKQFTIIESYPEDVREFIMKPCDVLFEVVGEPGSCYESISWLPGTHVEEFQYEGGSIDAEAEVGDVRWMVDAVADPEVVTGPGWYVIEDLDVHYSRDYYGDVDTDITCTRTRVATNDDFRKYGVGPFETRKAPDGSRYYVWGQDRNDDSATAHCYEGDGDEMNPVGPLCIYGWNRSNGFRFSIFRGIVTGNMCKTCLKRQDEGKGYVEPKEHKTRWL